MFKYTVVIFAIIACVCAKPALIGAPLAYTAPAAAVLAAPAPVVTATSSQFVARNHNGIATAPVVAPVVAKTVAAPVAAAYTTPVVAEYAAAYSAPLAHSVQVLGKYAAGSPLDYNTPIIANSAAVYSHPLAYSAPLTYAAAPTTVLL